MNLKNISRMFLVFALSFAMLFSVRLVSAHQDPGGCDSNGVGLSLSVYRDDETTTVSGGDTVQSGETIKYRATLSHLGGTNCNFDGGVLSIITPDGANNVVTNPVPLVTFGSDHVSSFQPYVVSESDVIAGNISAVADYSGGTSHTGDQHDNAQASVDRNTPYEDVSVVVEKNANPTFNRECTWEITKVVDVDLHDLGSGDSGTSNYDVTVSADCSDTDFAVSGIITVHNPADFADAIIESLDDSVNGIAATVDCTGDTEFSGFPHTLGPDETLTCEYSADLSDGESRVNTATATTSGDVDGDEGTADVDFTGVDPTETLNEEVTVDDTYAGSLGSCNAADESCLFEYERTFTCDADAGQHDNTATIVETGQQASASVTVMCTPDLGCTLTQGYWKTHSENGPAPFDETWDLISGTYDLEDLAGWGMSWYDVFHTAPKGGNVWYQLAHQWMAAYLNMLSGASTPTEVSDALTDAETWLILIDPADNPKTKDYPMAGDWASLLADYNEGEIGPGHCE